MYASGDVDRLGANGVVEVYPGAALTLWGFERRGYKSSGDSQRKAEQRAARRALLGDLAARAPWLDLSAAQQSCVDSDDALDAVLAALVARATAMGLTLAPPAEQMPTVRREGWIQLPAPGSFDQLAG